MSKKPETLFNRFAKMIAEEIDQEAKAKLNNDLYNEIKKPFSIAAFENILAARKDKWQRKQDYRIIAHSISSTNVTSFDCVASKTSICGSVKITYNENFTYDKGDADSFSTSNYGPEEYIWSIEIDGFKVVLVDEYGDELITSKLEDYLDPDFSSIDYSLFGIGSSIMA